MNRFLVWQWTVPTCLIICALHLSAVEAFTSMPSKKTFLVTAHASLSADNNGNGNGTPSFDSLGLSPDALKAVQSQPSWETPTPVQQLAIPRLLSSKNNMDSLWCEAPTGSGKTAAFALPLLQRLSEQRSKNNRQAKITSLILCPTRELAVQIGSVIQSLSSHMESPRKSEVHGKNWRVQVIHGGVPLEPQISSLARCVDESSAVDVLVATPGRMVDVLTHYRDTNSATDSALEARLIAALDDKKGSKTDSSLSLSQIEDLQLDRVDDDGRAGLEYLLEGIEYLVIDEADRLLSRAFESEVNAVLDLMPEKQQQRDQSKLQTWLFSATFPKQIEPRVDGVLKRLAGENAKPPVRIILGNSDRILESNQDISESLKKKLERTASSKQQVQVGPASTIELRTIRMEKRDRTQVLRRLLQDNSWDRVLVFVATRYASEHVARKLRRVGIESAELHGKLDQDARTRRLKSFSSGKVRVLLATDVASRGLDVVGLPAVVNYDLPRSTADFVHRVGRTGRAGRRGTAVTFVTSTSESQLDLIEMRHLQEPVEREILPGFEIDEDEWMVQSETARISAPGVTHTSKGLAHDRMHGGIKGHRKSKKDKMREKSARETAEKKSQ